MVVVSACAIRRGEPAIGSRYLFSTSSRFISSLASIVQAASVAASSDRIGLRLADGDQLRGVVGMRLVVGQQLVERSLDDRPLLGAERAGTAAAGR